MALSDELKIVCIHHRLEKVRCLIGAILLNYHGSLFKVPSLVTY